MKWNYAGAGGGTIFHVPSCVPGSFLHVAPGTAMPSEAGLHASRARELGVQIPEKGGSRLTRTRWWQRSLKYADASDFIHIDA